MKPFRNQIKKTMPLGEKLECHCCNTSHQIKSKHFKTQSLLFRHRAYQRQISIRIYTFLRNLKYKFDF